ncbi:MAG: response regulator [Alphaproteobacteria bacterium]|nr:response regulator [Alphaproteobacteria bacterium]
MDGTILIADDDRTIRTVLTQAFTRAGCKVHATASLLTLTRWVEEGRGDLVISDVVMPDGNGLETLPRLGKIRPDLPVIIISAQNTIMTAIKAAEAEAYDYLPKPFDLPDLMKRSAKALEGNRQNRTPETVQNPADELPLVGRTPVMQALYRLVARVLNTDLPVLITGESGTGKSLIARTIHDYSDRRTLPFVVAGANALEAGDAVHNQLAQAKTGSILFDEVGDLSAQAQARLVRALDSLGDHAPRVLATTQQDLAREVEAGNFRGDLFYRLNAVSLNAPPLQARIDDIPLLADYFLARQERDGGEAKLFTPQAHDELRKHIWPGNVRQLEHVVRRLAVTCPETRIGQGDVHVTLGPASEAMHPGAAVGHEKLSDSIAAHLGRYFDLHGDALPPSGLYGRILRELEVPLIEIALDATGGNQAKCADLLGINRNTLRKKIVELDIRVTRRRKLM